MGIPYLRLNARVTMNGDFWNYEGKMMSIIDNIDEYRALLRFSGFSAGT